MKFEKLVGERFRERPSDCVIDSHALMIRGGYMKYVTNGIFSLYTPLRRITQKIECIIREEIDAVDGQEVLFPVVLPASLWEESGRYSSVGSELMRISDRNGNPLVLGMTHEEAAVHLVREFAGSYTKYPFMIYQIQTKFRDEARPRGGLIRVREFTMKDAYSFHTSQADLEEYYERCFHAYERIFKRAGLKNFISVASDSGMMGGSISHEFMLLTPVGEDSIAICSDCDYRANMEAAECIVENTLLSDSSESNSAESLSLVNTPDSCTIEEVCEFLNMSAEKSCKAVVYQKNLTDEYVILFIRGDLDVNETKLTNYLGEEIHPAVIDENSGIIARYTGPVNLSSNQNYTILFDRSLGNSSNLFCGANVSGYHYTGLNISRDCGDVQFYDFAKIKEGGICPRCGKKSISISRGIEIGNIFQLGTKYSKAMNMQYTDSDGEMKYPIMGCYGIGVGRLAASVCEESNDEYGPIWPMSIAPWQVHLCCVRADNPEIKNYADSLYNDLTSNGIEVIYDDRNVSAGVMFSDADLLGIPLRLTVSPRNMKDSCCEITSRDKKVSLKAPFDEVIPTIKKLIHVNVK